MKLFLLAALISCQVFASAISSGGANCSNVADGLVYKASGGLCTWSSVAGTGDVVGPASSTDNGFVRFDGTTGKAIQDTGTGASLGDSGDATFASATLSNLTAFRPMCSDGSKKAVTCTDPFAIARGGTNSTTALNNNRVMQSSGGAIVEAAAISASKGLCSDANGIPVACASGPSTTEMSYVTGLTSAAQTQIDSKLTSTGFVEEWPIGEGLTATSIGNDTYPIIPYSALGRKVVSIRAACGTSGTITAKLQIDGVDITTCTGISVSSTPGTTTCDTGSTSTLAANSALTLVLSSNSSCTGFYAHVKTTRQ